MPLNLTSSDADFQNRFSELVNAKREADTDVSGTVRQIIADVRGRGDEALHDLTRKLDRFDSRSKGVRFSDEEIDAAVAVADPAVIKALEVAASRIEAFHQRQMPEGYSYTDDAGVELGLRWSAVDAVGLYVPGGLASYPSSVMMNAIPAKVAGVARRVMTVPTPDDVINPLVLAAARIAGITEIYRLGGAQAVAALAYGTESVAPVDKIVGPGNAYVAEAKRQVFGAVGIDSIAGPSEILVVADGENDPSWIAIDLLSQAEHDEVAQAILITDDADFARRVEQAISEHLATLPKAAIASTSWENFGAVIVVGSLDEAPGLIDRLAPEHLELAVSEPKALADKVRHAGAIFLGRHTPEAIGDYVAGPNHVLPTSRTARFSSGLGVLDFMKRTTTVECDPESLAAIGPPAVALAEAEGLAAHGRSIATRLAKS